MKYALRKAGEEAPSFLDKDGVFSFTAGRMVLYPSQQAALAGLAAWARRYPGGTTNDIEIVAVEEIPGETKREVVELAGVADLDGLKFAVVDRLGVFWQRDRQTGRTEITSHFTVRKLDGPEFSSRVFFDSIEEAIHLMYKERRYAEEYVPRIVGIRETTSPSCRVVHELVPRGPLPIPVPHDVAIAAGAFKPGTLLEME